MGRQSCRFRLEFLIIGAIFIGCNETLKDETKIVSPEEMQTLLQLDNVQLVDVRTSKEFKEGHIENAQNIDFLASTFTEDIKKLDKNLPILIYCHSGGRSAKCVKKLLEAGFVKLTNNQIFSIFDSLQTMSLHLK